MQHFFQTSFYVLLFFSIYGMAALLFWLAYLLNKSCDKWDEEHKEENEAFLAACEAARLRDLALQIEQEKKARF